MKNISLTILLTILMLSSASQAQTLPELSDSASQVLNAEQEKLIGQQIMLNVRQQTPFSSDALLQNYIYTLTARLVEHSPRAFGAISPNLALDSAINAFAVPGGYVTINTGLIDHAQSEDELAAVIAHEIGHHSQRHISRSIERSKQFSLPAAAALIGGILLGGQAGTAAILSTQALLGADRLTYSKIFEGEADATGMQILADAGYSTAAMPAFFSQLEKRNRLMGGQLPAFLSTHPVSSDRIADSLSRIKRLKSAPRPLPLNPLDYAHAKTRMQALYATPAEAIIKKLGAQASDPSLNAQAQEIANYGLTLAYIRKGAFENAQTNLDRLTIAQTGDVLIQLTAAELALASGKSVDAIKKYSKLYQQDTQNTVFLRGYAQALLQNKDYAKLIRTLRKSLRRTPEQLWAYKMLALAYGAQGNTLNALYNKVQGLNRSGQYTKALTLLNGQSGVVHSDQSTYLSASIEDLNQQILRAKQRLDDFKL